MIFCHDKIYAKVWQVTKAEKYLDLRVTTSEKTQEGEYINSSWWPRVIGHAFNSLKDTLSEGNRIVITKSKLTNESYTAKDGSLKSAFRFLILEANIESSANTADNTAATTTTTQESDATTGGADACPW